MLSNTARGLPRFSITSDRPSSSTRRRSLPKLARASSAVTPIPSFINSPIQLLKLYGSSEGVSTTDLTLNRRSRGTHTQSLGATLPRDHKHGKCCPLADGHSQILGDHFDEALGGTGNDCRKKTRSQRS